MRMYFTKGKKLMKQNKTACSTRAAAMMCVIIQVYWSISVMSTIEISLNICPLQGDYTDTSKSHAGQQVSTAYMYAFGALKLKLTHVISVHTQASNWMLGAIHRYITFLPFQTYINIQLGQRTYTPGRVHVHGTMKKNFFPQFSQF